MLKRRGVVRGAQLAPVYTFGAPAVFCEEANHVDASTSSTRAAAATSATSAAAAQASSTEGLLARLGLSEHIIRNVVMSRDIVPRAFACDYSLVASVLRSWGPAFKNHVALGLEGRKHLYYFVGRMTLLQPSLDQSFVHDEPYHPMLPPRPEAFTLAEPSLLTDMQARLNHQPPAGSRQADSLTEAVCALMDTPHPLETLGDKGAYLESGTISR